PIVFLRLETASQYGTHSQSVEVIRGDDATRGYRSVIADAERSAHDLVDDEGIEELAILLEIAKVRPGDSVPLASRAIRSGNRHQPLLAGHHGEWTQQNTFNPTEDRCICADTESQAEERL